MAATGSVTFVPSVHFSPEHRRRVRETIREVEPDLVAVELDERRFDRLERAARLERGDLARELPPEVALPVGLLRAVQRTVARLYGLDPDETDMEAAVDTAAEIDVDVALIDDPLSETLAALADRLGPATVPKLFLRVQRMRPEDVAEQFEAMTVRFSDVDSGDDVEPVVNQLRRFFPEVTEVLIDRRDRAMAERLDALRRQGHDVVAVVGAAHHNGVRRGLDDLAERDDGPSIEVPIRTPDRTVVSIPVE